MIDQPCPPPKVFVFCFYHTYFALIFMSEGGGSTTLYDLCTFSRYCFFFFFSLARFFCTWTLKEYPPRPWYSSDCIKSAVAQEKILMKLFLSFSGHCFGDYPRGNGGNSFFSLCRSTSLSGVSSWSWFRYFSLIRRLRRTPFMWEGI